MKIMKAIKFAFSPWPFKPVAVTTVTTAFLFMVVSAVVVSLSEQSGVGARGQNAPWIFAMAALCFAFCFSILYLGSLIAKKFKKLFALIYHLTAIAFSASTVLVREILTSDTTPDYWQDPISKIRLFVVVIFLFYFLHASFGISNFRIAEEAKQAKEAKAALEVQRGRLIDSQEQTRKEIADFLHDRLQSDLVVLGIQINRATESMPVESREVAKAFVEEIERIRQIDVREASRALAPELDGPGIAAALNDLSRQYLSVFEVKVQVDQKDKIAKQQRLAIYRIVEQALLNAAKHGSPRNIEIVVKIEDGMIRIWVTNDGRELAQQLVAGAGFAIIDTWVSQYRGQWTVKKVDTNTTLWAEFPIAD
jgi:signal transduction histidine kinase